MDYDYDVDIRVHRSDCWDDGNSTTRFYEYNWDCPSCGKRMCAYERPYTVICNDCEYLELLQEDLKSALEFYFERKEIKFDKKQLEHYANIIAKHLEKILNEKTPKNTIKNPYADVVKTQNNQINGDEILL